MVLLTDVKKNAEQSVESLSLSVTIKHKQHILGLHYVNFTCNKSQVMLLYKTKGKYQLMNRLCLRVHIIFKCKFQNLSN